ncbi:MAG: hypothetical protein A2X34_06865 [Elusimicrobia bacterium GWC2_51_8]|nr:MAG: hypothetical protein A2X33_08790 [Elusimicrobia bacterium GWA2_51_34]OGR58836.1 MAG: hypothetical protein A2X34_06865 [Elusimicrobia bacterium GWC2_51_8]OGR87078.1 MAG: hypothetical protein A2021_02975 [Elusimicrobia bacterium GWF2_52_66]HAF96055.1 hypothetical protein [Elusimicrobiota bacterium]HCE98663.1 hypothetical protein [Elusimicrobiota bacterium]
MKKIILAAVACTVLGLNAAAYFSGGASSVSGPDGYHGTNLNLVIGSGNLAIEPSLAAYTWDTLDDTFHTYTLRGAWEAEKYTVAGLVGSTPEVNGYSNKFFGGDITVSLTPGEGGKSRLTGPGSRGGARGGQGVTRIDVGAGLKQTMHTQAVGTTDNETSQTEGSLFAGAKILMVNLSASYTGYKYGDEDAAPLGFVPGLSFAFGAFPKSSVNVKLDLPGFPMVTPFVSYTGTKYKGGRDDSSAYLFGAYLDLSMVTANVGYQMFDNGSTKDNYLSVGAGIKF